MNVYGVVSEIPEGKSVRWLHSHKTYSLLFKIYDGLHKKKFPDLYIDLLDAQNGCQLESDPAVLIL